jgi:hypothetical protein
MRAHMIKVQKSTLVTEYVVGAESIDDAVQQVCQSGSVVISCEDVGEVEEVTFIRGISTVETRSTLPAPPPDDEWCDGDEAADTVRYPFSILGYLLGEEV